MNPIKFILSTLSPAGASARLSILIFHRVLEEPDPLFPGEMHAQRFDELCGWMAEWFNVLPMDQAIRRLKAGTLPVCPACITFDDGYADNYHVATPILRRHGLTATFFIATGFLNGGRMWNDTIVETVRRCQAAELDLTEMGLGRHAVGTLEEQSAAISVLIDQIKYRSLAERVSVTDQLAVIAKVQPSKNLMLTSAEVKAMHHIGMQIGAHTVSHPILAGLSDDEASDEIKGSKDFLESLLGERVGLFAYPNGKFGEDYGPATVDVVRRLGFDASVTTQWGASCSGDDPFQIKRFTPWDKTRLRFAARLMGNLNRA